MALLPAFAGAVPLWFNRGGGPQPVFGDGGATHPCGSCCCFCAKYTTLPSSITGHYKWDGPSNPVFGDPFDHAVIFSTDNLPIKVCTCENTWIHLLTPSLSFFVLTTVHNCSTGETLVNISYADGFGAFCTWGELYNDPLQIINCNPTGLLLPRVDPHHNPFICPFDSYWIT